MASAKQYLLADHNQPLHTSLSSLSPALLGLPTELPKNRSNFLHPSSADADDDDDAFFHQPVAPRPACKTFSFVASKRRGLTGRYLSNLLGRRQQHSPVFPSILQAKDYLLEECKVTKRRWTLDRANFLGVLPPVLRVHDISQIRLKRLIGSGGFGMVYLGQFRGRTVAVKKFHRCVKNIKAKVESFKAECSVQHLRHSNIVQVLATSSGDPGVSKDVWIVMEYAGDKDLQHVIDDPCEILDFRRRVRYAVDIISGLRYIHEKQIIHLDVKPANIIITLQDGCKLGDFGCSQTLTADSGTISPTRSYLTGTFAYRAPELLRGEPASAKADVYSFGVTLWHMLAREPPYGGQNQHVVMYGVVAYAVRPRIPPPSQTNDRSAVFIPGSIGLSYDSSSCCSSSGISSRSSSGSSSRFSYSLSGSNLTPEEQYRDLYVQCWDSDPQVRQSSSDVAEILEVWSENVL